MNSAVIVETRSSINLKKVIDDHVAKLDDEWRLTVFYGENEELIKDIPANKIKIGSVDLSGYNDLLTTKWFWDQIPDDKILIFQHDSGLLKTGISKFLEWDWVGAPWKERAGGNGGLSIRSKKAMLKVIGQFSRPENENEDLWFCRHLRKIGYRLAPRAICEDFSCETIFRLGTLGYHGIDKYLTPTQCRLIKNQYKLKL